MPAKPTRPPSKGAPAQPTGTPLAIDRSRHGPFTVMKMAGPLVATTTDTAEAELLSAIVLPPAPLQMALDLTEVTAIDSHGVALLAKTSFAVNAVRGTLYAIAPPDSPSYSTLAAGVVGSALYWAKDLADLFSQPDSSKKAPPEPES